jgi:hypothetical protein
MQFSDKHLLFRVIVRQTGHEYKIYTNGEIEGFGENVIIVNHYGAPAREIEMRSHRQLPELHSHEPVSGRE